MGRHNKHVTAQKNRVCLFPRPVVFAAIFLPILQHVVQFIYGWVEHQCREKTQRYEGGKEAPKAKEVQCTVLMFYFLLLLILLYLV